MMGAIMIRNAAMTICGALVLAATTTACQTKASGSKEMAESLKTHLQMNGVDNVSRVVCPPNAKAKKGKKYECTVHLKDGKTIPVLMHWENDALFRSYLMVPKKDAEKNIKDWAAKQVKVQLQSVECPKQMIIKPKAEYICKATDQKNVSKDIRLWIDEKGGYRWEVAKKQPGAQPGTKPATPEPATPEPAKK